MPGLIATYVHGNAAVAENRPPDDALKVNYLGWGMEASLVPGHSQWFHIPLPTPVMDNGIRYKMTKFFLLHEVTGIGGIQFVHLYHGRDRVAWKYRGKGRAGDGALGGGPGRHLLVDGGSTFELEDPIVLGRGMGISFFVSASAWANGDFIPTANLVRIAVVGAGADYMPS